MKVWSNLANDGKLLVVVVGMCIGLLTMMQVAVYVFGK